MKTLVGPRWRDIDNPAMEALPLRAGVGEIMEGRALLGYQFYGHNPILPFILFLKEKSTNNELFAAFEIGMGVSPGDAGLT
jgi:hypothetical protein